jgi:large subunit ribosomal protein L18
MNERIRKLQNRSQRAHRVRAAVSGTADRPRLCIRITNTHINVQLINDETGTTLASATTVGSKEKGSLTQKAASLGTDIAKKAKAKKVKKVVLDRGSRLYHGRVKAFAEAARAEGLEF